jgi:hypothetical protein
MRRIEGRIVKGTEEGERENYMEGWMEKERKG